MEDKIAEKTNRIVHFTGDFNEKKSEEIIRKIINLEISDPSKDILIHIDSYGGLVHSLLSIYDIINYISRCDIATLCTGKAMSCGQILLASGKKGKRFATPNARILVHQLSAGTRGKLSDMETDINETKELNKILEDIILKHTKINKTELKKLFEKDSYISAKEALKYGIIDHIIESPKSLYKKINI
jgi:ATP-dependent Clp protease protease subunit